MSATRPTLSIAERKALLDAEVTRYVRRGFRVQSRTDTTAQLVKPKKFSLFWAGIWLLCAVFPFIVYLLWYAAKRDTQVYLQVDEQGKVTRTKR
jgi:hypothetical protein